MNDITRRDALKAFAVVSMANVLDVTEPHLERALRGVNRLSESDAALQQYTPRFFNRHEWQLVRLLSDYVIPKDERSGSATEARVPEFIDFLMSDKDASENSKTAMRGGLAWMDNEARSRFGKSFAAASDADRRKILDDIAWPKKARDEFTHGVAFFTRFRDYVASGFFSTPMGWRDVQYIGNVFNPNWDGCPAPAMAKLGVSQDLMNSRATTDLK